MVLPGTFGSFSLNTGFACTGRGSSAASSRGTPNNAVARTKPAAPETQRLIDVSMIGPRCAQTRQKTIRQRRNVERATSERQALVHDQVPAHRPDAAVSDHHDVPGSRASIGHMQRRNPHMPRLTAAACSSSLLDDDGPENRAWSTRAHDFYDAGRGNAVVQRIAVTIGRPRRQAGSN